MSKTLNHVCVTSDNGIDSGQMLKIKRVLEFPYKPEPGKVIKTIILPLSPNETHFVIKEETP